MNHATPKRTATTDGTERILGNGTDVVLLPNEVAALARQVQRDAERPPAPSFRALANALAVLTTEAMRNRVHYDAPLWDVVRATVASIREQHAMRRGRSGVPCLTLGCTTGSCHVCEERDRLEARIRTLELQVKALDGGTR